MKKKVGIVFASVILLIAFLSAADAWMLKGQVHDMDAVKGSDLIGMNVANREKIDLGTISDIVIDVREEMVVFAVLSPATILNRSDEVIVVPVSALSFLDEGHAILNITVEKLRKAPGFNKNKWPVTDIWELAKKSDDFFGITPKRK